MARASTKKKLNSTSIKTGYSTRSDASITRYAGREMIATFAGSSGSSVVLSPSNSSAPRLTVQSYSWERYRWMRCVVQFVPIVGMNASGNLIAGVDFTTTTSVDPSSRSAVAALSPMVTGPLWDRMSLVVPANRLNTLTWMPICPPGTDPDVETIAAATMYANISGSALDQGVDVWLDYIIEFSGPKYPTTTIPTQLGGFYAAIPLLSDTIRLTSTYVSASIYTFQYAYTAHLPSGRTSTLTYAYYPSEGDNAAASNIVCSLSSGTQGSLIRRYPTAVYAIPDARQGFGEVQVNIGPGTSNLLVDKTTANYGYSVFGVSSAKGSELSSQNATVIVTPAFTSGSDELFIYFFALVPPSEVETLITVGTDSLTIAKSHITPANVTGLNLGGLVNPNSLDAPITYRDTR